MAVNATATVITVILTVSVNTIITATITVSINTINTIVTVSVNYCYPYYLYVMVTA